MEHSTPPEPGDNPDKPDDPPVDGGEDELPPSPIRVHRGLVRDAYGARLVPLIGTLAMYMFADVRAIAADTGTEPPMTEHQMIRKMVTCMRQRMSVDKTISYSAAAKTCKDQVLAQRRDRDSGMLVASDDPQKH